MTRRGRRDAEGVGELRPRRRAGLRRAPRQDEPVPRAVQPGSGRCRQPSETDHQRRRAEEDRALQRICAAAPPRPLRDRHGPRSRRRTASWRCPSPIIATTPIAAPARFKLMGMLGAASDAGVPAAPRLRGAEGDRRGDAGGARPLGACGARAQRRGPHRLDQSRRRIAVATLRRPAARPRRQSCAASTRRERARSTSRFANARRSRRR